MLPLLFIAGWAQVLEKDGVTVEAREVGKPYPEHRVSAHSALTVEQFMKYFHERFPIMKDDRLTRKVVSKTPERMVFHDVLKMPVGSDRVYDIEFKRKYDGTILEWQFKYVPGELCDGCVTMDQLYGSWTFSPGEKGGTDIVYQIYSDPGGSFPKFMVGGKLAEGALDRVRRTLKDAQSP